MYRDIYYKHDRSAKHDFPIDIMKTEDEFSVQ